MLQWLFFEQYSHEPYIAVVRFWVRFAADPPGEAEIEARRRGGYAALDAMERHLASREFLVGERFTIADIALYAYTHVAGEAGFEMDRYEAIAALAGARRRPARAHPDHRLSAPASGRRAGAGGLRSARVAVPRYPAGRASKSARSSSLTASSGRSVAPRAGEHERALDRREHHQRRAARPPRAPCRPRPAPPRAPPATSRTRARRSASRAPCPPASSVTVAIGQPSR